MGRVFTMSLPDDVYEKLLKATGEDKIQKAIRKVINFYLSNKDKVPSDKILAMLEDVREGVDKIINRLGI